MYINIIYLSWFHKHLPLTKLFCMQRKVSLIEFEQLKYLNPKIVKQLITWLIVNLYTCNIVCRDM